MIRPAPRNRVRPVLAQLGMIGLAFTLIAIAPPAGGRMLLMPLDGRPRAETFAVAIAQGALPISGGPIAGSLIVVAPDGAARRLFARGLMPLAAPPGGCGSGTASG